MLCLDSLFIFEVNILASVYRSLAVLINVDKQFICKSTTKNTVFNFTDYKKTRNISSTYDS